MDISEYVSIGDLMEVECDGAFCSTKVNEIEGDRLIVDYLTTRGRPVHLREKEVYSMVQKKQAGLYFFAVRYERKIVTPNREFFMEFSAMTQPVKNQRRDSFRVTTSIPVSVVFVSNIVLRTTIEATCLTGPRQMDLAKKWQNTYIADISEQGLLIHMKDPFPINAHIMLRFEIDNRAIFANAVVKRHAYENATDPMPNMIGVEMLRVNEKTMREIRKYVMKCQLKERVRELGQFVQDTNDGN